MTKMKMQNKKVLALVAVIIVLLLAALSVWYSLFDTTGLRFYNGEDIEAMIPFSNQIYMIDGDGKVFLTGGHERTGNRKYRNAEFKRDDGLGCFSPVLIFDGLATEVLPYDDLCALIITESGTLYNFVDFESTDLIAEKVQYAFYGNTDGRIYYIDLVGSLYSANSDKPIYQGVKKAHQYNGALYILNTDGELIVFDENRNEMLFDDVLDFDILDTSARIIDGKYTVNDPDALSSPLINLLTGDGRLYANGTYNHLSCGNRDYASSAIKTFDEWTVIDDEVDVFSASEIGTVYTKLDGSVWYYGFDSIPQKDSVFEHILLEIDNVTSVYADKTVFCIKSEDAFFLWGGEFELVFDRPSSSHGIISGSPIEISPRH